MQVAKPVKVNHDQLAADCVGKDIVTSHGYFYSLEATPINLPGGKKIIQVKCQVVSHRLCADNLVHGTQAMGLRVFNLDIQEAKKLAAKPKVEVRPSVNKTNFSMDAF